ncbi:MAG: hypothetical protein J6D08_10815 [Lachnospiraceae bacterium]|nr:hypothetical protein [Lachnospiraceae bacterium]
MEKISINPVVLYQGCIVAAIAHAVAVGEFPELNYEHSWDGCNYCMNDSQGRRATITFHSQYIIAVFQDVSKFSRAKNVYDYLSGMPDDILKVAESEALQYVLEDMDGEVRPVITAAFWGNWNELFSNQPLNEILENGGYIVKNQLLDYHDGLKKWDEHYGFDNNQKNLILSLFQRKMKNKEMDIRLSEEEIKCLYGDIEECRESLQELNIHL